MYVEQQYEKTEKGEWRMLKMRNMKKELHWRICNVCQGTDKTDDDKQSLLLLLQMKLQTDTCARELLGIYKKTL